MHVEIATVALVLFYILQVGSRLHCCGSGSSQPAVLQTLSFVACVGGLPSLGRSHPAQVLNTLLVMAVIRIMRKRRRLFLARAAAAGAAPGEQAPLLAAAQEPGGGLKAE